MLEQSSINRIASTVGPFLGSLVRRALQHPAIRRGSKTRHQRGGRPDRDRQLQMDEATLRRLDKLMIVARRMARGGLIGEHRSARRAVSLDFADYRRYVPGDDLRRVDWNVYGRLETAFVKLTEARQDIALHLLLDCSQSMDWGQPNKLAYARQLVAALGYVALTRFDAVTVTPFSDHLHEHLPLTRGKHQMLALVDYLSSIEAGGSTDLEAVFRAYCQSNTRSGVLLVVSDLLAPDGYETGLMHLARSGREVGLIHLLHERELRPDLSGQIELLDVETGEVVEMTVGPEALLAYEKRVIDWCAQVQEFCTRHDINYLLADTSMTLDSLVLRYLRHRRFLK